MRMLKIKQVADKVGYSSSSVYRMIADGEFPQGKKIGKSNRWADYVVDAWIIMFWELNEPLPKMSSDTLDEIIRCVGTAKERLTA